MPYFSKSKMLTKDHIIQQFIGDTELLQYLPDVLNRATVTRDFLLALLFNIKREKCYEVDIKNDYAARISNFISPTK